MFIKRSHLILSLISVGFFCFLFVRNILSAGGGAGPARFFFTDPDNYAAGGAMVVLEKNLDTGEVVDVTLDRSKVILTRGNYFFGKLAPDCSGLLEFTYPPAGSNPPAGSGSKYYDLRWVTENNLYRNNIQVEQTNFLKIQENFLPHDPGTLMYADLKVDGFDYNNDGQVSPEERLETRNAWSNSPIGNNCGPGPAVYYGSGGQPTPTMMPWPPLPSSTPMPTSFPTSTPYPTSTPWPTSAPYPTAVPTSTPIPTPTASPFETTGFVNPGSINVSVAPDTRTHIFNLTSTTATGFSFYGYPTSYGPGISFYQSSGGMVPGGSTPIDLYVAWNVEEGTYTGFQRLISTSSYYPYSLIPVTVVVSKNIPTATPVPTSTPTPTPVPQLSFSSINTWAITRTSATVNWMTNVPSSSLVKYGTTTNLTSSTVENLKTVVNHQVTLFGLTKGRKYYYQVYSRDYTNSLKTDGKIYSFTTVK